MTSKEALQIIKNIDETNFGVCYDEEPISEIFKEELQIIERDLEVLEIIKKVGIISLVFDEDPYCNLVITDKKFIDIDYDGSAPDIEMTYEEYIKIMEWLTNDTR